MAPLRVSFDLVYSSSSACRGVALPSTSDALATQLLPADAAFRGNLQLSKAASGDGCALYLTLKGAVTGFEDAFAAGRSVHLKTAEMLASKGMEDVTLARAAVSMDGDKLLAMSLQSFETTAPESVLTVQKGDCSELLKALESDDALLPRQVETSALDVVQEGDDQGECVVGLEIAALAPKMSATESFQLLKAVDDKMDAFFATQESATVTSVNVRLQVAQSEASETQTLAASENATSLKLNAPTYEEAMGIFALVAVLVAMMMGVMVQKKRNDQRSRERYERANRAAQIRRVSIRMSQYDQEENEELEGEEDSLL